MAKQTFTSGQVLTAAQMTSLQETAMGGGNATAKTANYVLVAADAGTVVAMNAAGATTITVNTGLFAAGDIVTIQNRGAGTCTITAGTATVNTAGSLALVQHEGGILYFTATGAAVFYDYVQAATASGGMTLLSTTTLTGASTTISSISGSYNDLVAIISGVTNATADGKLEVKPNGNGNIANQTYVNVAESVSWSYNSPNNGQLYLSGGQNMNRTSANNVFCLTFHNYASTTTWKPHTVSGAYQGTNQFAVQTVMTSGGISTTSAITSLEFVSTGGNLSTGTVLLYGVK